MKKNVLVLSVLMLGILTLPGCFKKNTPAPMDDTTKTPDAAAPAGANADMVEAGDTIKVNYVGKLEDGSVFDTSLMDIAKTANLYNEAREYTPLEFTVAAGQMIPGFDKGVVGMKKGEKKTMTIVPADAYGDIREDMVQQLPLSKFKEAGIEPKIGETYNFQIAQGKVIKIEGENVTMDFNHFLAGKTLIFDVEIVDIMKAGSAPAPTDPTAAMPTAEVAPAAAVAAETGTAGTGSTGTGN